MNKKDEAILELQDIVKQQNQFILDLMNNNILTDAQKHAISDKYNKLYIKSYKYLMDS